VEMKRRNWLPLFIVIPALMAAGCSGGGDEHSTEKSADGPPVSVTVQEIMPETIGNTYRAVGTVKSDSTVMISAKVMGFVQELGVREGDTVKKGEVLAKISASEITAGVKQAEAGVEEANRALDEVTSGIAGAEAGLAAANAGLELAEATYNRFKKLVEEDSVSRQEFDEVKAKYEQAKAEVLRAEKGLEAMKSKKKQVLAKITQAESAHQQARAMLGYTTIKSPMDAIVIEKRAEPGDLASPGMPLMIIENSSDYQLHASVEEAFIDRVSPGDAVEVEISALGDSSINGTVAEIVPSVDPSSRTFTVKIDLPVTEKRIRSGMYGKAKFKKGTEEVFRVPPEAVVHRGQMEGVFVVDEGTARLRIVKIGRTFDDGSFEILSGLNPGDTIVVSNARRLDDSRKVVIEK